MISIIEVLADSVGYADLIYGCPCLLKILAAVLLGSTLLASSLAFARDKGRGGDGVPTVFVISQGLYYDSIVVADPLPMEADFQRLISGEMGLMTQYGPGEVGHPGGRWWVDVSGDGVMNEGDHFFLCPLPGPGRETL